MVQISNGEEDLESKDDFQKIPPSKKLKPNYDKTRRFLNKSDAKLVCTKPIRRSDEKVHLVKCMVCSTYEKNPKILGPKWDILQEHKGRKKATFDMPKYKVKAGEWYILKTSCHQINLRLFATK